MRALWIVLGVFVFTMWDVAYDHGEIIGTAYDIFRQLLRTLGLA